MLGCVGGGHTTLKPATQEEPAIVTKSCVGLPMDPFSINESMSIENNILRINVGYGGGCEEHTFAACWDGSITKTNPSTLTLSMSHDDHDDLCDAFVQRDLFIDLTGIPAGFGAPARSGESSIRLTQAN